MPLKAFGKGAAGVDSAKERTQARKTRGRSLIIIGAVLFVCTYTLKEVFRDELKGFSDSLAAGQSAVDTGDAQQIISAREIAANIRLRQLQEALADPSKGEIVKQSDLQGDLADLSQSYSDLEANVERVSELIDRLPRWVRNLDRARTEIRENLDEAHRAMLDAESISKRTDYPVVKKRIMVLLGIIHVDISALMVAEWEKSIMKTATVYKTITDILYEVCTWGALVLTIIGIVLAAKGKLHGDEDIGYE